MNECDRCNGLFGRLMRCAMCHRKVCGGCSWKSTLNGKRVCTKDLRCVRKNRKVVFSCTGLKG